ncbi:MAG: cystathionine beta-lyase [Hyphobacterium sp.]|nr:MAG: cystathionine beta-lyase [Hyphobacterium sp.]
MKRDTQLMRAGRAHHGNRPVNPAIERGSTVLATKAHELYNAPEGTPYYGRNGLGAQTALRQALCEMTQAHYCALTSSGLAAMTLPIIAEARSGAHMLAADCIYGPTRKFLTEIVAGWGVDIEFFPARCGAEIADRFNPDTALVICESPGSLTFEIQDIPAIAKQAHRIGAKVMVDDTWSAGLNADMLGLGADYAAQSLTKYIGGHSDLMLGAILARGDNAVKIKRVETTLGSHASAEDCFLALRGIRTLGLRMEKSTKASLKLAERFVSHPDVGHVIHPARSDHPDHTLFKRDFKAAAGLFAVNFPDWDLKRSERFLDALKIFGLGFSWGGFESLAIHCDPQLRRQHSKRHEGALLRFAIGLEDVDDLWQDIEQAINASV